MLNMGKNQTGTKVKSENKANIAQKMKFSLKFKHPAGKYYIHQLP